MRRRLSVSQRQAIMKWSCLALSAALFVGSFFAVPYIVAALPKISGETLRDIAFDDASEPDIPAFALGAGSFENLANVDDTVGEYTPDEEESIPIPTPSEDDLPVSSSNLCWYKLGESATLNIINRTSYKVNLSDYLERDYPIKNAQDDGTPLVLIVHTHGSESYLQTGYDFYSPDETFRSLDESETVVHIGDKLAEKLNSLGINTIHDRKMYDQTDFNKSYNYSRVGIIDALEKYPTIKYVIDLHRDSVFDSDGNNIKPLTNINGEDCAQLMLVVGTNEAGAVHPNWRDNLTFATHLQDKMNTLFPTLARPINLRTSAFNQALATGSVLLEVGSCGNTIEEAENAISLFAEAYAGLIKENMG